MSPRALSIEERLADLIASLDVKFSVERAILFGSTAKGNRLRESDVDLIIVSKGFEDVSIPERQAAIQREWNYPEELEALTYTPAEFSRVSKRFTMKEILSDSVDVSPFKGRNLCPKCGKKGSIQTKIVRNRMGKSYPFLYFAHYVNGKTSWCYLGSPKRLHTLALTT